MRRFVLAPLGLGLALALGSVVPSSAQVAPTVNSVIGICAPVISEQYAGDDSRYGTCIEAVGNFLTAIGAPSPESAPLVADLVVALVELYENDEDCLLRETELPEAITLASTVAVDEEQRAQILLISATITECQAIRTAAIRIPTGDATQSSAF